MPDDMRSAMERNIRNAFRVDGGPSLMETDSSTTSGGHKFPAIHFAYYARHGTRVCRILPSLMLIQVTAYNRERMHHQMFIPSFSDDKALLDQLSSSIS